MADEIDEMLDSVKREHELQFPHRTYYKVDTSTNEYGESPKKRVVYGEANLVSSQCENGMHAPALDIDLPCRLVPSGTEGHFHFYIDKQMTWEQYCDLMDVLQEVGVLEKQYVKMCKKDKRSYLRLRPDDPPKRTIRVKKPRRTSSYTTYSGGY